MKTLNKRIIHNNYYQNHKTSLKAKLLFNALNNINLFHLNMLLICLDEDTRSLIMKYYKFKKKIFAILYIYYNFDGCNIKTIMSINKVSSKSAKCFIKQNSIRFLFVNCRIYDWIL